MQLLSILDRPVQLKKIKNPYIEIFIIAFLVAMSFILPYIILDKGLFLFFGDYCVQQVPFYSLAHDAIRSGSIGWNWNTDLGANFIGSYAFYLLGSPFFWLTVPLPSFLVPYMLGPLLALKIAIASVTAYAYISRFVKTSSYAMLGGLLYAFSSYSIYDIFFNHFHEPMAFFPLLLIGLEEFMENDRKGVFAAAVFLNAFVNYNFFVGDVVFVLIYWLVRLLSGAWEISMKKYLNLFFEAVIGFGISCVLVIPAVLAITGNPRTSSLLSGWNLLVYNWPQRYGDIIHSVFFPQDLPSLPNFFPDSNANWSSVAAWLPMFSMVGVISYLIAKPKTWLRRIILICFACALIPLLNSMFVLFNDDYYGRWFFMGVLMLALATAIAFEDPKIDCMPGLRWTFGITLAFSLGIGLIPKMTNGKMVQLGLEDNPPRFWAYVALVLLGLVLLYMTMKYFKKGSVDFANYATIGLIVVICIYGNLFISTGKAFGWDGAWFKSTAVEGASKIKVDETQFSRIDVLNGIDNQGMFWHLPTINAFQSVVPASIMNFYNSVGVQRDVASRPDTSYPALRPLLSVKYLFDQSDATDINMPGWTQIGSQLGFKEWEDENFIPMGFTYNNYITQKQFNNASSKDRLLLKGLLLDSEQIKQFKSFLKPISDTGIDYSDDAMSADCVARRTNTCSSFAYDNKGFSAKITLPSENLVFFSVPFDSGWSAIVNGKPAKIQEVNIGFMAVDCPAGTSIIRFNYTTPGLHTGMLVTGGSLLIFVLYLLLMRKRRRRLTNGSDDNNIILDSFSDDSTSDTTDDNEFRQIISEENNLTYDNTEGGSSISESPTENDENEF